MYALTYDYLRPPRAALDMVLEDREKKYGVREKMVRSSFYLNPLDSFEEEKLAEFEESLRRDGLPLPNWWRREETLRWLHGCNFKIDKAVISVRTHLKYLEDAPKDLNPGAWALLQKGIIYQFGRDRRFRPVLVVDCAKIVHEGVSVEDSIKGLIYLLQLIRETMFLPGYVEQWVFILEAQNLTLFNLPLSHIRAVIEICKLNYPSFLSKMFILNMPFLLNATWNMIKGLLDPETVVKIDLLKESQLDQIQKKIAPEMLEKRFGGQHQNMETYWPPQIPQGKKEVNVVINNNQYVPGFSPTQYRTVDMVCIGPGNWKIVEPVQPAVQQVAPAVEIQPAPVQQLPVQPPIPAQPVQPVEAVRPIQNTEPVQPASQAVQHPNQPIQPTPQSGDIPTVKRRPSEPGVIIETEGTQKQEYHTAKGPDQTSQYHSVGSQLPNPENGEHEDEMYAPRLKGVTPANPGHIEVNINLEGPRQHLKSSSFCSVCLPPTNGEETPKQTKSDTCTLF
eukprot:TRINITY_DN3433_c0_g1_i8.p1 TRINITY_DN3433_c0_g1~~TRINITY_DN3433_c0_g1_i8.p1  ORF type:complete len:506 (-),score=78.73 TRINITY_DN3433_c0_g1_i8:172-1689(-)